MNAIIDPAQRDQRGEDKERDPPSWEGRGKKNSRAEHIDGMIAWKAVTAGGASLNEFDIRFERAGTHHKSLCDPTNQIRNPKTDGKQNKDDKAAQFVQRNPKNKKERDKNDTENIGLVQVRDGRKKDIKKWIAETDIDQMKKSSIQGLQKFHHS